MEGLSQNKDHLTNIQITNNIVVTNQNYLSFKIDELIDALGKSIGI